MKTRQLWRSRPRVEELEGRIVPATLSNSTNWAGYAVAAGANSVTQVSANWVVPTVSKGSSASYSSAWVGIDGFNSSSVEQLGTDSDYTSGPQYYAWYEMYPNPSITITSMTIKPGDTMSASVTYIGSNNFTLSITDVTSGGSFSTTQSSSSAQRSSAEVIQEAPSSIFGVLPLANFGTINFSQGQATVNGATGPLDNSWSGATLNQINMVTNTGALKASTGALSDSGSPATSSFSVTFVSSGSGGKGHGHSADDSVTTLSVAAAVNSLGRGALTAAPQFSASAPAPTSLPATAVAGPSAAPALPASSVQIAVTVAEHRADAGDFSPTTGQPAAPELLPAPADLGAPGNGAAPATPDGAPAPAADQLPASPSGATPDSDGVGDAFFAEGRWESAASPDGARADFQAGGDEGTSTESAGLVLALALGGTWAVATREAASRGRRQRPF
jgi:hypothetical protein